MKTLVALALAASTVVPSPADPPYEQRLAMIESLGTRYAGHGSGLGLFDGIREQTAWQLRSGRDRIVLWDLVNAALTVEPFAYAAEFERMRGLQPGDACARSAFVATHPTRDPSAGPPLSSADVCEAWMAYFRAAAGDAPAAVRVRGRVFAGGAAVRQSLIWTAHSASMVHAVWQSRAALEESGRAVPVEFSFWANWIQVVLGLDVARFPTGPPLATLLAATLTPPCSPLGTAGCDVRQNGPLALLGAVPASIDSVFAGYRLNQALQRFETDFSRARF